MTIHLEDFLPENISDETAFHLANFVMDLALALDSHYFMQMNRYCKVYREEHQVDPF